MLTRILLIILKKVDMVKIPKGSYLFGVMILLSVIMTGCEFVEDIFKAGIWVGILIVIAIIAVIGFLIAIFKKK